MSGRRPWTWILALSLAPAAAATSYGCALVGGIHPPAPGTCDDGLLDGDETKQDCGGVCGLCDGDPCAADANCKSGICFQGKCTPASSTAACPAGATERCQACHACADGIACVDDGDCLHGLCQGNVCWTCGVPDHTCPSCRGGSCLDVTCANGVKDGAESDVDCGGDCGAGCGLGQGCALDHDCATGVCDAARRTCVAPVGDGGMDDGGDAGPSCHDQILNGSETSVDCGGLVCPQCGAGKTCKVDNDCVSGNCVLDKCL